MGWVAKVEVRALEELDASRRVFCTLHGSQTVFAEALDSCIEVVYIITRPIHSGCEPNSARCVLKLR